MSSQGETRAGWAVVKKWAVALLALASLASLIQFWHSTIGVNKYSEALKAYADRLELARQALPVQRGEIGYLAEWDVPGVDFEYADQEGEFILAQYALAPLILRRGADHDWNLAVLSDNSMQIWQELHAGEYEITYIKYNMYLLHKLDP